MPDIVGVNFMKSWHLLLSRLLGPFRVNIKQQRPVALHNQRVYKYSYYLTIAPE